MPRHHQPLPKWGHWAHYVRWLHWFHGFHWFHWFHWFHSLQPSVVSNDHCAVYPCTTCKCDCVSICVHVCSSWTFRTACLEYFEWNMYQNKNHQSGAPTIWKQSWNKMHKTNVQWSNIHIQVHIKLGNHWQTSLADIAISHGASTPWAFLQVLECFLASLSWAEEVTLRGEPQGKLEGLRYTNDVLMTKNNQKLSTV